MRTVSAFLGRIFVDFDWLFLLLSVSVWRRRVWVWFYFDDTVVLFLEVVENGIDAFHLQLVTHFCVITFLVVEDVLSRLSWNSFALLLNLGLYAFFLFNLMWKWHILTQLIDLVCLSLFFLFNLLLFFHIPHGRNFFSLFRQSFLLLTHYGSFILFTLHLFYCLLLFTTNLLRLLVAIMTAADRRGLLLFFLKLQYGIIGKALENWSLRVGLRLWITFAPLECHRCFSFAVYHVLLVGRIERSCSRTLWVLHSQILEYWLPFRLLCQRNWKCVYSG